MHFSPMLVNHLGFYVSSASHTCVQSQSILSIKIVISLLLSYVHSLQFTIDQEGGKFMIDTDTICRCCCTNNQEKHLISSLLKDYLLCFAFSEGIDIFFMLYGEKFERKPKGLCYIYPSLDLLLLLSFCIISSLLRRQAERGRRRKKKITKSS